MEPAECGQHFQRLHGPPPPQNPSFPRDSVKHTPFDALKLRHGWLARLRWRGRAVPLDASTNGCNKNEKLKVCDATGLHQLREKASSPSYIQSAVRTRSAAAERLESITAACPRGILFHLPQHLQPLFLFCVPTEHILSARAVPFRHINTASPFPS